MASKAWHKLFNILPWRPKGIVFDPLGHGDLVRIHGKVCGVLRRNVDEWGESGDIEVYETHNIVTNAGDLYYAERAVLLTPGTTISPVPTNFTSATGAPDMIMELYTATGSSAPAKGNDRSSLGTIVDAGYAMDSGYPKVNDADSDNTGAGTDIATYLRTFSTAQGNGSDIDDVILTNPSPGASEAILMHADGLGTFTKTSSDTLKVFVNHTFNGT